MEEFNSCLLFLRRLEATKLIIENSINNKKSYCACGEAAAISVVSLAYHHEVSYAVEEMNILSKL